MNWTDKYQLIGIKPGKVVLRGGKSIDFSDPNLSIERVDAAFDAGTRFLKLKKKTGKETNPTPEPLD